MRYEVKLALAEVDLPKMRAALTLLPAALRPLHPERIVQSVYFDTWDGAAVHESLAGLSERRKLRLRWYGDDCGVVRASLECKRRSSGVGDKDVFALPAPIALQGVAKGRFLREVMRAAPPAWRERLAGTEPVQWIRYRREYLGSFDGGLRITVDRELVAWDQRFSGVLACRFATPLPRLAIVELKADVAQRRTIEGWLQGLPWRPGRCSKFLMAMQPAEAPSVASPDE